MPDILKRLFSPPSFEDDSKTFQAYLLFVILWGLIFVPVPYVLYVIFNSPEELNRALLQTVIGELVNLFLFYLLHRGYVRAASLIQVGALWLFFTVTAITGSGVMGEGYLLGYPLVIVIAGILTSGRTTFGITMLSLVTGGLMVYAENNGILVPSHRANLTTTWVISLAIFPMGMILQYLSRKVVQNALKRASASEERYRLISGVTTDYTFATEVDPQGGVKLVWVAGAFENLTGYTFEEYIESGGWTKHLHPDDVEKDAQDMAELRQNRNVRSEIRTYTKSGEMRWGRISAHPIWDKETNSLKGIVGAVQDITHTKAAEEKLKQTMLQQSAILNGIPDTAWLKDKDSRYIEVNEQFARVVGLKAEEIIGRSDFEIWQKDFAEHYRTSDLEIMRTGQRIYMEETQIDGKGREYWVETIKTPIHNLEGEVVGTVGITREISDRKKAESEREALINELEAKNAELEQFTYTVSHDLKSPLVTITGFLAYLEQDARKGDFARLQQDVSRIQQAVDKMQSLLRDLLELSRIGRLMNPPTEFTFTELVSDALELVRGQIETENVSIVLEGMDDIQVTGDRTRLIEVIQNLVDNATKFMGPQTRRVIAIGSLKNEAEERVFYVRDNGIGIPPEFHERIFGLFNKLNSSTEGTGIGLTLVKRIIEVHGGHIWLESRPGKGSTFYFTLL
ncbi:MAG: PAS domain S-box protein [Anaerolineales bacterium]|nr:PAS domain S-box protein [Anaerolineales bacterium]